MKPLILAFALAALPLAASAQQVVTGPNGGPVVENHGHFIEMTSTETNLVLFLTEGSDKPLTSAGTTNARAIVQDAGKTATVALQVADPNKLVGTLAQPLGTGARVVVSATLADGHTLQARFINN